MAKLKVSATLDPRRLQAARELAGVDLAVSEVIDLALAVFIEHGLERRWLAAHQEDSELDFRAVDLPGAIPVDWSAVPWDDPAP